MYRPAEIVSGAYKLREKQQGCGRNDDGTIDFRPLTEAELLKDSMAVMLARQLQSRDVDAIDEPTKDCSEDPEGQ